MKIGRFFIILGSCFVLAFLLHILAYQFNFTFQSISNVSFAVGMVFLLVSVVAVTNAYKVFQGINYALRTLITPSYRNKYPTYRDYKEEKSEAVSSKIFFEILIASGILVAFSFLFWGLSYA